MISRRRTSPLELDRPLADRAGDARRVCAALPRIPHPQSLIPRRNAARGFTLVELLITISIIAIMSSMVLFAMWQAQETAKEHRTRALITKLNDVVMRRYDDYRTRRVPYLFPAVAQGASVNDKVTAQKVLAKGRIDCLRDIIRMEMPDRWSDVTDNPVTPYAHTLGSSVLAPFSGFVVRPAASQAYLAKYNAVNAINPGHPTTEHQGAECLYRIVMQTLAQEGDSRDFFKPTDLGDLDEDGCPEFLDAWGQPIQFIRWAPGFQSSLQTPIRLSGDITSAGGKTATFDVGANHGPRLNQSPGSYVGGTIAVVDKDTQIIDTRYMARITGYQYVVSPPSVKFTCETPGYTDQIPFAGQTGSYDVVVMQPDPFDSREVYPIYNTNPGDTGPPSPNTSVPTYAIYPLIFSKGKDRVSGIVDDVRTLSYADPTVAMNPFYIPPAITEAFGLMLGSALHKNGTEPNWYKGSHNDNITNHQLGTR